MAGKWHLMYMILCGWAGLVGCMPGAPGGGGGAGNDNNNGDLGQIGDACDGANPCGSGLDCVDGECAMGGGGNNNGGDETQDVALKFAALVGDQVAECGTMYAGLGTSGENAEMLDLRFYVSAIHLIDADGEPVPVTLEQDGKWQVEDVALLDFENGLGKCGETGTVDLRSEVTGTVPTGEYNGIVFELGVPFDMNHDDLAAAPAPLNVGAMFWAWAIGHKFLRVDLETEGGLRWNMHLGSTMCESGGPQEPPVAACGRPNRPVIMLSSFDPADDTVILDLEALFADSDLTQDTPDTASGCQTFPDDENECHLLFPNLGLDFVTGRCVDDCMNQSIFRVGSAAAADNDVEAAITRGQTAFTTTRETAGGSSFACADCHAADGSGDIGPDIRSSTAGHFLEHAQGDGPHPDGIKFDDLTESDFGDIEIFLASICQEDPDCESGSVDDHDHGDEGEDDGEEGDHDEGEDE
jgi:uncharacterized repeat protein (TIGR04052 family)